MSGITRIRFNQGAGAVIATLTVAASDSSIEGKTNADYICNGVHDEVIINTAIAKLTAGGKVLLLEGTFNTEASINLLSDVTLEGSGWGTIIDGSLFAAPNENIIANADSVGGNSKIIILNLRIVGNVTHAQNVGIELDNVADCIIRNLYVYQCGNQGIAIRNSDHVIIQDCICDGCDDSGVFLDTSTYCIVANNLVRNNVSVTSPGIRTDALGVMDGHNVVKGNIVENCGIGLQIDLGYDVVIGNSIHVTQHHGIFAVASNLMIMNNVVVGAGQLADNTYDGIRLTDGDYSCIQANLVRRAGANDTKYGINIQAGSNNNLVTNNDLYNSGQTADLQDDGTATITVAGNRS